MKIETDKFYKTRFGHKVYVYALVDGYYLAVIAGDDWYADELRYSKNGKSITANKSLDIIAEWKDDFND